MNVVKVKLVKKEVVKSNLFTKEIIMQNLFPESKEYKISNVHFEKGVRTKLHTHESEQILIVTGGNGIVGNEYEKRVVEVGDVIFFSAGEIHWHGATEESDFSHIFILKIGQKTKNLE